MTSGKFFSLALLCVFWLFSSLQSMADNGSVAYAHPVENISIDGDLSDWPAGLPTSAFQSDSAVDKADLHAVFRAGYHLESQSLYVAVEVSDDSYVAGKEEDKSWDSQDSHLLYIDMDHSMQGSGALLFGAMSDRLVYMEVVGSWDPKVAKGRRDMAEMVQKRVQGKTIYEWRIRTGEKIRPGTTIGIDHLINDMDVDDQGQQSRSTTLWGKFYGKSRRSARLGDLVLVDPNNKTGTLKGAMRWHKSVPDMDTDGWRIRIQSVQQPAFWVQPELDKNGAFTIKLPVGKYKLTSPFPIYGNRNQYRLADDLQVHAQVVAGKTTQADPLMLKTVDPPKVFAGKAFLFSYEAKKDEKKVDRFIEAYMDYFKVPGVSAALVRNGKQVYAKDFGVANVYTGEPITKKTLFEAGSVTKIVFAFAVHRLAERGVIDLDQPLHEILPFEDIAHDDRYRLITARHVLAHQTGFPNWARFNDDGKIDIQFTPGTGFRYSGEAFEYLGRVVTHITKKDLDTILEEEALVPMGFNTNTFFSDKGRLQGITAFGHLMLRPRIPMFPQQAGVAWSMHTNAHALTPFMLSLMGRKGLSPKGYKDILTPRNKTSEDWSLENLGWKTEFSLGFQIRDTPFGKTYGHGGSNDGNECVFEIFDEKNAGFIVMTNGNTGRPFFEAFRSFLVAGE